jgi:hypothetical protein
MSQMWPSKVRESSGDNEKPPNNWKTIPKHPKKSRFIAFTVPRLLVDDKVVLLWHSKSLKLNKKWKSYEHW